MQALTPPCEHQSQYVLSTATNLLQRQAKALSYIADMYTNDSQVQAQFFRVLTLLHNCVLGQNKIVLTGMGKSLKIAEKLVATLHSFGIATASLHPSDALHGDLGMIKPRDVVIMVSSSGSTAELLQLWDHLPSHQTVLVMTCSLDSKMAHRATEVVPVVIPDDHLEVSIYGLAAPTVTTTACLAVGDAICISLFEMIEADYKLRRHNFGRWHPGGAIGRSYKDEPESVPTFTPWHKIPKLAGPLNETSELDLWRAVAQSELIIAGNTVYYSADILNALKSGQPVNVNGYPVDSIPRLVGPIQYCTQLTMSVEQDEPQGLIWSSDWS